MMFVECLSGVVLIALFVYCKMFITMLQYCITCKAGQG